MVTPFAFRSRSAFSVGCPPMNMSSPTVANFAWNIPVMSWLTGSGTGPVLSLPTMLWASAERTVTATVSAQAAKPRMMDAQVMMLSREK